MTTDTKAVERWDSWGGEKDIQESDTGQFVLFADHERVVGDLQKEIKGWEEVANNYVELVRKLHAEIAASRAEVEGLLVQIRGLQDG